MNVGSLSLYDVKQGYFDQAKSILKFLPFSCAESMTTTEVRSFQIGTEHLCRSKVYKVATCQSWSQTKMCAAQVQDRDDKIILQP